MVECHKLDRRSDVDGSSIDLHLDKPSDLLNNWSFPVKLRSFRCWHKYSSTPIGASPRTNIGLLGNESVFIGREPNRSEPQGVLVASEDSDSQNRPTLTDNMLSQMALRLQHAVQQWYERICSSPAFADEITRLFKNFFDNMKDVYSICRTEAIHRKIPATGMSDFANIFKGFPSLINDATISGSDNLGLGSNNCYGCSMREVLRESANREHESSQEIKWVRERKTGMAWCWPEPHNSMACNVDSEDIDVSSNGKRWFHLVGSRCRDGLPNWIVRHR